MDQLQRQVRRAQRRLNLQQFLRVLPWSMFVWLVIAALGLAVPKIWALALDDQQARLWNWGWTGGGLALGVLSAVVWTWLIRRSSLDAALEIDRRYALKERVSSSLALDESELASPAGQALLTDALRRVERIDVGDQFRVRADWRALLPALPAVAIYVLMAVVANAMPDASAQAGQNPVDAEQQIKRSTEDLKKKIAERRKEAEEKNLEEAGDLFKRLEQNLDKLAEQQGVDRKQAMVELNDLAKDLAKRRENLGDQDQLRKQLGGLKDMKQGPADKMAKAIKDGDFQKALEELKNLQDQLKNGDLDEEKKEQLAQQLEQMQNKLQEAADAHKEAKQELERQIKEKQQAGDLAEAAKLQQQLDKLERQNEHMDKLSQMAQKLGQCSKCLKGGNPQDAAGQLDQLAQDLQQLQQEADELESLDEAMEQLADAKNAMNCKQCNGQGCKECQGEGIGQGKGNKDAPPGRGLGEGRGKGDRPEAETDTSHYDSQVRGQVGPGSAVVTGDASGPNVAGKSREEIKEAITAAKRADAQPLSGDRLPRSQREHVKQYLDSLREGK